MRFVAVTVLALALVATATATPDAKRRPAPLLAGVTLDGKQLSLTKLRGKPVFINVWSSW
ncbi:MAG: TlpA family protein disulfide reductase [Gaiellaceae bacterium]